MGGSISEIWEDDIVARCIAIDNLEGIALSEELLARRVVENLCIYLKANFPLENEEPREDLIERPTPRLDLQRAITAIGRIIPTIPKAIEDRFRANLSRTDLSGVDFTNLDFFAANLSYSRLEGAIFNGGNFEGCFLTGSLLNYARFWKANFKGARLNLTTITEIESGFHN